MGYFAQMAGHISGTRAGYWSLKLIENGTCSYIIDGNTYILQPGTVFLTHGQGLLKRDQRYRLLTIMCVFEASLGYPSGRRLCPCVEGAFFMPGVVPGTIELLAAHVKSAA